MAGDPHERIIGWKKQLFTNATGIFGASNQPDQSVDLGRLHPKTEHSLSGRVAQHQPWNCVLPAQACQFTAEEFVEAVIANGVQLSMDSRGAWRDNVFVERVRRLVRSERVYLKVYESVIATGKDIAQYIDWYNGERGHSSLDGKTPKLFWSLSLLPLKEAA